MPAALAAAFFLAALLYASVGFGGGSTYAALLALSGLDYRLLPVLALSCNIVVVGGASLRFARARLTPWRGALGLTALAAPASLLGGLTPISQPVFMALLGAGLVLTGAAMLVPLSGDASDPHGAEPRSDGERDRVNWSRALPFLAAPIGYLAGLVGIGGGIFLAPFLHLARWRHPRQIAATASLFILINSAFGIAGQILKGSPGVLGGALGAGLPLLLAVAVGGQIGSLMAAKLIPPRWIRWLTALLVAAVGARLLIGG